MRKITVLLLALLAHAHAAHADSLPEPQAPGEREFTECRRIPDDKRVAIALKPNSELPDLVGWIKSISCRPFIYTAAQARGSVTIVIPEPVSARVAYRVFLSAIEAMGLTIQPEGTVLKLVDSNRAREGPTPVVPPGQAAPAGKHFVTRLLQVRHGSPQDLATVLARIKGRDGDITPYPQAGVLLITDQADNVRRIEQVARALDVPQGGEQIWWVPLRHTSPTETAQLLQQLSSAGKEGGKAPERGVLSLSQVVPEERGGALILVASEPAYRQALGVIKRLEEQAGQLTGESDRTHVYPLQNASAEDVANVLQGLGTGTSGGGKRKAAGPAGAPVSSAQAGGGVFQEQVHVAFDRATNLLIITAAPRDYQALREILRHLDVPRRQVFIEATVMEVSLTRNRNVGLTYYGAGPVGDKGERGGVVGNFGNGPLLASGSMDAANALARLSGVGFLGPAFNLANIGLSGQIPSFGIVLNALQQSESVNILQNPSLLTLDNEKASLLVGKTVPFPTTSFGVPGSAPGGGAGYGTSYQRQDVALRLDITPHVSAGDLVRLEIENEISQLVPVSNSGGGPITDKRQLKTMAVVRDQEPVVLGGILQDVTSEIESKVPFLGDIPLLGALFRNKQKRVEKQALLIILTPYIINDPSDLRRIRERKQREQQELLEIASYFQEGPVRGQAVDYRRKRGVLVELGRSIEEVERESAQLRQAQRRAPAGAPGPIEPAAAEAAAITPPRPPAM